MNKVGIKPLDLGKKKVHGDPGSVLVSLCEVHRGKRSCQGQSLGHMVTFPQQQSMSGGQSEAGGAQICSVA